MSGSQDPELSAALGWLGGISDPVLDRKVLLQKVAALRLVAQRALEALEYAQQDRECPSTTRQAIAALRAALAQQVEPVAYTTGHCENHKQKGGCQLHNLQCGWPDCDRKPTTAPPRQAVAG